MEIKTVIRRWLGLTDLEDKVATLVPREAVARALSEALEGPDRGYYGEPIRNRVEQVLREVSVEVSRQEIRKAVIARLGGEEIIDEIVERINRKQLTR